MPEFYVIFAWKIFSGILGHYPVSYISVHGPELFGVARPIYATQFPDQFIDFPTWIGQFSN